MNIATVFPVLFKLIVLEWEEADGLVTVEDDIYESLVMRVHAVIMWTVPNGCL